jgi:hypothetical protein
MEKNRGEKPFSKLRISDGLCHLADGADSAHFGELVKTYAELNRERVSG